ncbi:hypothetical protein C9374_005627 [Naegleria lovaniensis]|uniref:RNA helicase n=1 Tax=Naegleria lovaniensis TaxID=51637 RepID=A0AA88GQV7_NAELO|nr:uncharacterized protein C9374_005627 [Naegleria lovaniensis]KAG2382425.1 hypothetical protein C9374_005627 [Naegleria lovaniensis]
MSTTTTRTSSSSLEQWVSDELYEVIKYSSGAVSAYVINLAKKYRSNPSRLVGELERELLGEDSTDKLGSTHEILDRFARQLILKLPEAHAQGETTISSSKSNKSSSKYSSSSTLLDEENVSNLLVLSDEEDYSTKKSSSKKRKKAKNVHLRTKNTSESTEQQDDGNANLNFLENPPKKSKYDNVEDQEAHQPESVETMNASSEQPEEEAPQNEENPPAAGEKTSQKRRLTREELVEQRTKSLGDRKRVLEDLRKKSRHHYLTERERKLLRELENQLIEEEIEKKDYELDEAERLDRETKRRVLQYSKSKHNTRKMDYYQLPENYYDAETGVSRNKERLELIKKREDYSYHDPQGHRISEQRKLENDLIEQSTMKFGAADRVKQAEQEQKVDLLVEDEIEFIQEILEGKREMPEELKKELGLTDHNIQLNKAVNKVTSMQEFRKTLPIYSMRDKLIQAVNENQVIIIVGETGSGKTTQLTQYLHEAGYTQNGKKIGCTQPRRVAAMSVAARVADEMNTKLGDKVGYTIRFEDCTSENTLIKYMTDGMLLREFLKEPDLGSYSVLMIDEAHERSLHTDILFGLVKDIARYRSDIRLIISSATVEAEKFSRYFDGAPIFNVPGRKFPVDVYYTKAPENNYLDAAVVTVLQIHVTQPDGDILVFLTGQDEIEKCEESLKERMKMISSKAKELIVVPIYSTLPSDQQAKIFEPTPPGARKCVLATNIAETSLTIDGIVYVIDSGYCKQNSYNPRTGMSSLVVTPISKAAAIQRAGRAGRVAPGKCFRLYTSYSFHNELEESPVPEIQRTNLGNVVLSLKSLGINDLVNFDFMDPPPHETLIAALEQLYALGALNDDGDLTSMGRRMAEFPLDPQLSRMLIASEKYGCSEEIVTICAMLSVNNAIFYRPKDRELQADNAKKSFDHPHGDHLTLLNVYNEWAETGYSVTWCQQHFIQERSMLRAKKIREQLVQLMERVEMEMLSNPQDSEAIRKAITCGFFYNVATLEGHTGSYRTMQKKQTVYVHPSSCLFVGNDKDKLVTIVGDPKLAPKDQKELPKWVVFFELVLTTQEYMRQVVAIEPEWLLEIAPHLYDGKITLKQKKMPKGTGKKPLNKR